MKILLLFLVIGSIAATPTNWILGEPGETCNSVCGKSNRVCNPDEQSKITSEDLIKKAMLNLGKSCNKVVHRDYPGTPFLGGQDCVYLTKGGNSVCDENKFAWHRALCYCEVSNWIIGNKNEACQSVCAKTGRVCNSQEQSKITTKDLFEDAMKKAGHRSCQKFVQRDYSGVPLIANDGKTCVYLNWGAKSVCDDVKYDDHSPICYCEATTTVPNTTTVVTSTTTNTDTSTTTDYTVRSCPVKRCHLVWKRCPHGFAVGEDGCHTCNCKAEPGQAEPEVIRTDLQGVMMKLYKIETDLQENMNQINTKITALSGKISDVNERVTKLSEKVRLEGASRPPVRPVYGDGMDENDE